MFSGAIGRILISRGKWAIGVRAIEVRLDLYYFCIHILYMPVRDKTYNKTCVISKDSDQHVHPPSMTRVLVYPTLDSPGCSIRHMRSAKTDQTARMHRLIWVLVRRLIVGSLVRLLVYISFIIHFTCYKQSRLRIDLHFYRTFIHVVSWYI